MSAAVRLSKRQFNILMFVATYQSRYGRAPTEPEILARLRVSSGTLRRDVVALQALGHMTKARQGKRKLRLTGKELA